MVVHYALSVSASAKTDVVMKHSSHRDLCPRTNRKRFRYFYCLQKPARKDWFFVSYGRWYTDCMKKLFLSFSGKFVIEN